MTTRTKPVCTMPETGGRDCATAGNLPACQLCPDSPTYWKHTATPPAANPWNAPPTVQADDPDTRRYAYWPAPTRTITTPGSAPTQAKWSSNNPPAQCVYEGCGLKTTMRSPKGVPIHMACAERWAIANNRRTHADTTPRPDRGN